MRGGTLSATHITKSFGGDVVLDDVSLVVPPRARIGVLGPNCASSAGSRSWTPAASRGGRATSRSPT